MSDKLMSVEQLRSLLDMYGNTYRIDFGDKYLVRLDNTGPGVIACIWIDRAEKDAADEAQKKREEEEHEAATSLPLDQSDLEKRLARVLINAGIRTIYELAQNDILDLLSIKGFGWKSISQVETELEKHGWYPGGHRIKDLEQQTNKRSKRRV